MVKMCAVFVDLEKAFNRVYWRKLTGILKKIGVVWKEKRLLNNIYMKQRIKVRLGIFVYLRLLGASTSQAIGARNE